MRTMTATEASRNFSGLLDAVERGETIVITRGSQLIAEVRRARHRTGADLRRALEETAPPGDGFADDIADALGYVLPDESDPWRDT